MIEMHKCRYCNLIGDEKTIERHEFECGNNPSNKTCYSCKYCFDQGIQYLCDKNNKIMLCKDAQSREKDCWKTKLIDDRIAFRPQRGQLDKAMAEQRYFGNVTDMIYYISMEYNAEKTDISISYYGYDERIGWGTYVVCNKGDIVGFCRLEPERWL